NVFAIWRQHTAPISLAGSFYIDKEVAEVRSLGAHIGGVQLAVFGARVPKSVFAKPFAGTVAIVAPKAAVAQLTSDVKLPDDVAFAATARPAMGRLTYATLHGVMGTAELSGAIRADVQAQIATGYIAAGGLNLDEITAGKLKGHGAGFVAFDVDASDEKLELPVAHAVVTAWGRVAGAPPTAATIALATAGDHIDANVGAVNDGIRAGVGAALRKHGKVVILERGTLVAATSNPAAATGGKAPVRGSLTANFAASGQLAPNLDLAVAGSANGKRLRMNDIRIDTLNAHIDAKHIPSKPVGSGRIEIVDARKGDIAFRTLTLAAGNRPDGRLQVSVRSQPQPSPWAVDADALVTMGDTIVVDLQRHFVRAGAGSEWHGHSGEVRISDKAIEVSNFATESKQGKLAVDASFVRAGRNKGDLKAKVDANVDLKSLQKGYVGVIDAHVDVTRTHGAFEGLVTAKASGLTAKPNSPVMFDGNVKVEAKAGRLTADVQLASAKAGNAKIALDVDAPKDITNAAQWRLLGRSAIRTAEVSLNGIDLSQVAKAAGSKQPIAGHVDGTIKLTATDAGGTIEIRDVDAPELKGIGKINADLRVTQPSPNELATSFVARLIPTDVSAKDITKNGQARVVADAKFAAPDRLFDPAAWQKLGANAFRGASLRVERLAFQPGTLERFGIVTQMRGELAVGAEIDEGMKAVRFRVAVDNLRGGLFAQPISTTIDGMLDDKSARARVAVVGKNVTLLTLSGEVPVTLAQLRADPKSAKTAKLKAVARIEQVPAVELMNVIGTSQITSGVLDGKVEIGGTVDKPTVDVRLVATDVTVPPEEHKTVQKIEKLVIAANWDGTAGKVAIDGNSTGGGTLELRASGDPKHLDQVAASLAAKQLDIAPLVAFMPGPAGGLGGQLEANFDLKGADPRTAELTGNLHITNGRIPIAPTVGTLFKGDLKVNVQNRVVDVAMTGKLGRGDVKLKANAPLDGVTPKSGKLEVSVDKVQLIGTTEPILTGLITADVARVNERWRANVTVERMKVKVPPEKGQKLSPVGTPPDLVYGGLKIHHGVHKGKDVPAGIVHDQTGPADFKPAAQVTTTGPNGEPTRTVVTEPMLSADIHIRNTFVESNEVRGLVGGHMSVTVGDDKEVAIIGNIALTRGVLDLFNRRYFVDKAALHFDGSQDPVLDVRITHDFPEVTTITEIHGRMSKPQLQLSSQPAQYSQAELLGFLLGGEPGGDPEMAPSATQRVEGAGASFVANKVGGYVKKALPVDIDVLRYEAASSTSSAAVTVGTWLTDTLFLAYRQHLEARPDENTGEGEIEYWIQRRLVVEGVAGDRGVNGVDMLWRRRW
ncbi:MAG TPA: translocation/assembly module TamB domain-containing protein, partial [Kofleriaceae bacterium]|nr:translocation/assembly module TamB domain-containing protein [Kofleriaceae bacterium]